MATTNGAPERPALAAVAIGAEGLSAGATGLEAAIGTAADAAVVGAIPACLTSGPTPFSEWTGSAPAAAGATTLVSSAGGAAVFTLGLSAASVWLA